jgi:hypothetical protein
MSIACGLTRAFALGLVLVAAAACTTAERPPETIMVRAGGNAIALVPVTPASLGCPRAARLLRYPVPCPTVLPQTVLGNYLSCGSTFMIGNPCIRKWHGWMVATGGMAASGVGVTPSNTEHLVMEAVPFRTTNYNLVANGPVWQAVGRPRTVRALNWITIGGRRMRWIIVPQDTQGSAMAGHLMLVWTTRSHTYALGFHNLWGMSLTRALDISVARHLMLIRPGSPPER